MTTVDHTGPARVRGQKVRRDLAAADVAVRITNLRKTFPRAGGTTVTPVDDISLEIAAGEFLVLLGPSGCGKTTLLRCLAGLESPDGGRIDMFDRTVFDAGRKVLVPPEKRGIGMIFQSYALWPHLTVAQNVAYPLTAAKTPKKQIAERVEAALDLVGIGEIAKQIPGRLSGGQQQRVSLARAIVSEPKLVLFDEPLSNVDAKVREELRIELLEMQQRLGFTAVYVTHDQVEAMELADRITVLDNGRIAQLAPPKEVYRRPTSRYVADFIGTANELTGEVSEVHEDGLTIRVAGAAEPVRAPLPGDGAELASGDPVSVMWRPEAAMTSAPAGPALTLRTKVLFSRFLGASSEAVCRVEDTHDIRVAQGTDLAAEPDDDLDVWVPAAELMVFGGGTR